MRFSNTEPLQEETQERRRPAVRRRVESVEVQP